MADEDITLDGKPLQSLRVADLKAALEQRNLPKSGQKNTLIKRLKGALMLENLQKSSSSHSGLQPNSQIGEEMCQNSFIKQYLAKQQELLRQRLEREAQQEGEANESPAVVEEDDEHSEDNDSSSYMKHHSILSQPALTRAEEKAPVDVRPSSNLCHQESSEVSAARMQRAAFHQVHKDPPAPSPPRAVASLSVRVLSQPDQQGLPPTVSRAQEKEGTAPSQLGSAHPVLHLSRSAGVSGGSNVHEDSDEDDDDADESEDDEDWGPGPATTRRDNRVPSQPQQVPPSASTVARSKRKLQPPQHIPPPQVHHTPMQLRHPTPPPSPPPNLFPLPDTPKQSPPNIDDQEGPRVASFPPPTMQRQDSDLSSRSSSPEPPVKRRPGPLSLLVHKMESEKAFHSETTSAAEMSGETADSTPGSSSESPLQRLARKSQLENRQLEEMRQLKEEKEKEQEGERMEVQEQERENNCLEKERKQPQEKEKQRKREEEKDKKGQEEQKGKERRRQEDEKRKEEKQVKSRETVTKERVVVTDTQDSDSSSDSDSKSDSSSQSSQSSSSSSEDARQLKKAAQGQAVEEQKKANLNKEAEKQYQSKSEVSEPSAAAVTEVEPDSESSMAEQPGSRAEPENSEERMEESTTSKAFAARKISLASSKTSPGTTDGGAGEPETGSAAGRKRRWGSSTAVTAKKPSISITTESLKSLIPDIKVQEQVVELHPEELQLSGDEENLDSSRGDQDKGLKIQRTVTQVVAVDGQENGQTNEDEDVEKAEREKQRRTSRDTRKSSLSEDAPETQTPVKVDGEATKVTPSDTLVRRSISQQKSGVSVTIDDPIRTSRQPSPPRGKLSSIIHVTNLVRPFTLGQLKELLNQTGSVVEEGFWIDKIKSHCFVTYTTTEEAAATRNALHGVKWPSSNPKVLNVDFCEQAELDFHKGVLKPDKEEEHVAQPAVPQNRLPPLMPERDRDRERDKDRERVRDRGVGEVRDLWAEREREMERRERARGEREWDRDKIREFARPGEDGRRSRSRDRERRRRERARSKERKTDKKEKGDEPPAKLLDDLFLKTKAAPCIYWLPLTEEQAAQRVLDRKERQKERERKRKEQQEEEDKKREDEKKERLKGREKEGGVTVSGGAAGRGADGDRERDRGRDREVDKKRESGHRPRRPSAGTGGGRRSRSCSNPRDRRR